MDGFFTYANVSVVSPSAQLSKHRFRQWNYRALNSFYDSMATCSRKVVIIKSYPALVKKIVIFEVSMSQARPSFLSLSALQFIVCFGSFA